jgi:hypothetical protein
MIEASSTREAFDQFWAVRQALNRVALVLLEEHLEQAAALGHSGWDDETIARTVRETREALLGVPGVEYGGWDETFPIRRSEEDTCPAA